MSGTPPALAVRDLEVRYHGGEDAAVRDVHLTVAPGGGLLVQGGPLSGKTSVLRAVAGLVPAGGELQVLGAGPLGARAGTVGFGPEGRDFAGQLNVREAVAGAAAMRPRRVGAAAIDDAVERAGLYYVAGYRTRRLDEEGFRRLSLAMAIVGDPDLVILDDPWVLPETLAEIAAARARGAAVLAAARAPGGLGPALGARLALVGGRPR